MTISSINRKAGPFAGNDLTVAFPFAFKVFSDSDVSVTEADALGNESLLTLTTDYTVSLNADQNANPGGTVTLLAPLASGCLLTATSALPYIQPTDLTNNGGFYPKVINSALDRLTIFVQQLAEQLGRSLKYSITSPLGDSALPSPVANNVIGWNSSANGFQNFAPADNALLSATLASSAGSAYIGYLPAGTGAVATDVQSKLRESVSVKDFGAIGDGVADDTAAIQAGIDYVVARGGSLWMPDGNYYITSTLTISESASTSTIEQKCSLLGEPMGTHIIVGPGDFPALYIIGSTVSGLGWHSHQVVENIVFTKMDIPYVGTGIKLENLAYFGATNLLIRGFNKGIDAVDCLTCHFERLVIRSNNRGFTAARDDGSRPNAITFISSTLGVNSVYAIHATATTTLQYIGGSIENNGTVGQPDSAVYLKDLGEGGAVGAVFTGVYVEGNAGDADIYVDQTINQSSVLIQGCTFNRINGTHFVTNNVKFVAAPGATLYANMIGNGFIRFLSYSPSISRKYVSFPANSAAFSLSAVGNYFYDAVEAPWSQQSRVEHSFADAITTAETSVSGAVYGTGNVHSGSYTPTPTPVTNVTSVTAFVCTVTRLGYSVSVSGLVGVTPTGAGLTRFDISIPMSTNLSSTAQLAGVFSEVAGAGPGGAIFADTTNERARCSFTATGASALTFAFNFTYRLVA